jgi:hypothetical protein
VASDSPSAPDKARLTINLTIDEALRVRILELGLAPSTIARNAIIRAVKQRELELELKAVREKDPRVTAEDLKAKTVRMRRLRGL